MVGMKQTKRKSVPIRIFSKTRDRLKEFGKLSETYDKAINRLLDEKEKLTIGMTTSEKRWRNMIDDYIRKERVKRAKQTHEQFREKTQTIDPGDIENKSEIEQWMKEVTRYLDEKFKRNMGKEKRTKKQ